jgi:hypothetical protein
MPVSSIVFLCKCVINSESCFGVSLLPAFPEAWGIHTNLYAASLRFLRDKGRSPASYRWNRRLVARTVAQVALEKCMLPGSPLPELH